MKEVQRRIKFQIIALAIMICVMAAFCGVVVFSLLSQSATVQNQITVSDDGQAKSIVKVWEALGPDDNSSISTLTQEPQFSLVLEKNKNEDSSFGQFSVSPVFGGENQYRYFLIKVEIQNLSTVSVNYSAKLVNSLGEDFVVSSQLEIKYYQNSSEQFALTESLPNGTIGVSQSVVQYISLGLRDDVAFEDLVATDSFDFFLNVEVSANEN